MESRIIPGTDNDSETKTKILNTATELFALHGFDSVSIKDIANKVGIKTSSLYYYYDGKESIFEDVLIRFENGYRHYFDWLSEESKKANSVEQLMENMFNKEVIEMLDPIGCLGIALVLREQHNHDAARKCVFELLLEHSIKRIKEAFDRLISNRVVAPTDTRSIATLLLFCVLLSNDIRLHEYKGIQPPIDLREMYDGFRKVLTQMLTASSFR